MNQSIEMIAAGKMPDTFLAGKVWGIQGILRLRKLDGGGKEDGNLVLYRSRL